MLRRNFIPLALVLSWGVGFTDLPFAFGDIDNQQVNIKVPSLKDSPQGGNGTLLVVIFKDGLPASGIEVRAGNKVLKTTSAGVVSFDLPAKSQTVLIPEVGKALTAHIVADQETQMTVNLLTDKNADVALEAPTAEASQNPATTEKQEVKFQVKTGDTPVPEATVLFSGLNEVFKTDAQGFVTAQIPKGNYAVSFFHPNYQTQTLSEYKVEGAGSLPTEIHLKPASNELEEVLVLAPKIKGSLSSLVEIRKQSSAVTDVLGAEQMARAGDSDAASSLRRVTGLTLVGGKYVYVRGLGERYSGVQMNQFSLPSPEPSRRVVPLDLFPTSIMESIIVQKSYSPDLPGEFGGGVIQLRTRSLPEKFFFRGNITGSYTNTGSRLSYQGGSKDWLGMDDGTRAMPSAIKDVLAKGTRIQESTPGADNGLTKPQLTALGQSLAVNYNTNRSSEAAMPGMSLAMGTGWSFPNLKIGTAGSALYGQNANEIDRISNSFNVGAGGKLEKDNSRVTVSSELETRLAGSLDFGVEVFKQQKITASTFILRNTTNLTQINTTTNKNTGNISEATTLDQTERQVLTQHLKGEHEFGTFPLKINWRLGQSDAKRDSPDRRDYTYDILNGNRSLASGASGNRRTFSTLTDATSEKAFDLTVPLKYEDRELVKFKVGMNQLEKNRRADVTRLYFDGSAAGVDTSKDVNSILSKENINDDGYVIHNLTNAADSYTGDQTIRGQYAMVELNPHPKWTLSAGFRQEKSIQQVNTFYYFDPSTPFASSSLKMNDTLPAYSLTWKPTEKLRARLAYSETLARPDFRELSTVGFIDDETRYEVQGNANLKGTVIKNIDHRWEYYFTSDEYASIGVFRKKFQNPIEVMFIAGPNNIQSFANAPEANNLGIELEGRTGLRHFSRALRRWTLLANVTFIKSEIVLGDKGAQTSASRPLQGQSPYVFNTQLQYDRPNWGFSSTLLYNIIGKRITEVGTNQIPDTYEQPFGQLDFVASLALKNNWTLSFRARNLLDPKVEATQADEIVRSFKRGRNFAFVMGATF
jgi:outer membrane receptor protein involved in Fe transport